MLVALAAAIALGLWQYGVWGHHRSDESHTLVDAHARGLTGVMGPDSAFRGNDVGRPVSLSGSWLPSGTVYVKDRTHAGRRGYWVVTPVSIGRSAMPVVRGWSAEPSATTPTGTVDVTGWLQPSEDVGTDDAPHDKVVPTLSTAALAQYVDRDLYSAYVVARTASSGTTGLAAVGPPQTPKVSVWTGVRNLLYAFQWWVFGGFAVFVWVRWCRDEVAKVGSAT
jgi:cytochrome oxidase assembly protein ShyY1